MTTIYNEPVITGFAIPNDKAIEHISRYTYRVETYTAFAITPDVFFDANGYYPGYSHSHSRKIKRERYDQL